MARYLPLQRKQLILDHLTRNGSATVAELSAVYGVSEMTIRRDLEALESELLIQRTHGGAVYVSSANGEPPFAAKKVYHEDLKERIAAYAVAHFVHDGAVIILEGGTTVTSMVQHLARFSNLTVVTNGLRTTSALQALDSTSLVICTGGILRPVSSTFVGPMAEHFYRQFHAETAFVSATGLTTDGALTDPNLLESQGKKEMIAAAERVVVLLDSTKFGQHSFTTTYRLDDVHVLITDDGAPATFLDELRAAGVDVRVVP